MTVEKARVIARLGKVLEAQGHQKTVCLSLELVAEAYAALTAPETPTHPDRTDVRCGVCGVPFEDPTGGGDDHASVSPKCPGKRRVPA